MALSEEGATSVTILTARSQAGPMPGYQLGMMTPNSGSLVSPWGVAVLPDKDSRLHAYLQGGPFTLRRMLRLQLATAVLALVGEGMSMGAAAEELMVILGEAVKTARENAGRVPPQ